MVGPPCSQVWLHLDVKKERVRHGPQVVADEGDIGASTRGHGDERRAADGKGGVVGWSHRNEHRQR